MCPWCIWGMYVPGIFGVCVPGIFGVCVCVHVHALVYVVCVCVVHFVWYMWRGVCGVVCGLD